MWILTIKKKLIVRKILIGKINFETFIDKIQNNIISYLSNNCQRDKIVEISFKKNF